MLLTSLTPSELETWITTQGFQAFRARQLLHWIYRKRRIDPSAMHNLPGSLIQAIEHHGFISPLRERARQHSSDGTVKIAFELQDGATIESVLIPMKGSYTFCISSQVGCSMNCTFCATASLGFSRNLQTGEMVSQVLYLCSLMDNPDAGFNVVFMGMGEPLLNRESVFKTVDILTSPEAMGLSPSRITLSTCGIISGLKKLANLPVRPGIAISLNATDSDLREELMPVTKSNPLPELLQLLREFPLESRERITIEYVLIRDMNDHANDARRLVRILNGIRCKVNLIPFNPFPGSRLRKPVNERVVAFQRILMEKGLTAIIRQSKGEDIQGACGQLAARHKNGHT